MNKSEILKSIYSYLDSVEVDRAVMACLRLSRLQEDYINTGVFIRELTSDHKDANRTIFDDTNRLTDEAQKFILENSGERWLKSRTIEAVSGGQELDPVTVITPIGEILAEIEQAEKSIQDLTIPSNLSSYDSAAFFDQYTSAKMQFRKKIRILTTIRERVKSKCLNYAISIEKQIESQQETMNFIQNVQNEVQNYFRAHSDDVYVKLQKADQLMQSNFKEDLSLLLTQVRRAIKSVADYFYPPSNNPTLCFDGKERKLDDEKYLNRLEEYVNREFNKSTSTDLLKAELNYFMTFARKLNDLASKGVHAEVTLEEAQQGYIGLYFFLFNICQKLDNGNI